jgi:cell division GTPase FtsZ
MATIEDIDDIVKSCPHITFKPLELNIFKDLCIYKTIIDWDPQDIINIMKSTKYVLSDSISISQIKTVNFYEHNVFNALLKSGNHKNMKYILVNICIHPKLDYYKFLENLFKSLRSQLGNDEIKIFWGGIQDEKIDVDSVTIEYIACFSQ